MHMYTYMSADDEVCVHTYVRLQLLKVNFFSKQKLVALLHRVS